MPKTATVEPNADLLARCEHALELLLTHRGNPSAEIERVLAEDPQCVFGHCLRAAIIVRADATASDPRLPRAWPPSRRHAQTSTTPHADTRPRRVLGSRATVALALERYGAIVIDWPRDILALVVAHALDFRLGRRRMMRDRIAQVLPEWDAAMPGYASVLAMYAFALEENGQYRRAEKMARRALALDPRHAGAIHVVAHVMEMQGRAREGSGIPYGDPVGMGRRHRIFRASRMASRAAPARRGRSRAPPSRRTMRRSRMDALQISLRSPMLRRCCGGCSSATSG